jgi:hypothetical protein
MTNFPILDLVVGLIFIYFILAIVNNSFVELLSTFLRFRSKVLMSWLRTILTGKAQATNAFEAFVNHPAISALSEDNRSTNYISSRDFATVLIDLICNDNEDTPPVSLDNIKKAFENTTVIPKELKNTFLYFLSKTEAEKVIDHKIVELEHFQKQIENWYDGMMDRLTGKFKRNTIWITATFATVLTCALNIDTLSLANYLYSSPTARAQISATAYGEVNNAKTQQLVNQIKNEKLFINDSVPPSLDSLQHEVNRQIAIVNATMGTLNTNIPIGWTKSECAVLHSNPVKKTGGLLISILAICLGAPFWFDLLSRLVNLRSSLKPKK